MKSSDDSYILYRERQIQMQVYSYECIRRGPIKHDASFSPFEMQPNTPSYFPRQEESPIISRGNDFEVKEEDNT